MDIVSESNQDGRAWLLQFLKWNIPTTLLFALMLLALFVLSGYATFLISGVLTLVYGGMLLWSRRLAQRDKLDAAAGLLGSGLAIISVGAVLHAPSMWPMAVLLNILAAVAALPYLRPARARNYFSFTWLLCLLLVAVGQWVRLMPEQVPYLPVIQIVTIGSNLSFLLFLLWQYHARQSRLLERLHAANHALRTTQAGLEAEVQARTSELRQSEGRARANAELYRTLIGNLSDTAILLYDADLRYLLAEGPLLATLGLHPDQLVGHPVTVAWPVGHPRQVIALHQRVLEGTSGLSEQQRPGRAIQVRVVPVYDDQDVITAGMAIYQDVTERKAVEQTLREERDFAVTLTTMMGQGLTVTDAIGYFEYVNPAFSRMTGHEPQALLGRLVSDFMPQPDREQQHGVLLQRQAGESSSYETRFRRADGAEMYVLVSGVPRFRDGQYHGNIAVITDLTERKQIEAALAYARDEALAASRLKSEFLANVSHELRTPLNAVIGVGQLLLMTELTEEQRKFTELIQTGGQTLLALINDLLDLTKIEAGRFELQHEPFDPRACLHGVVELMIYLAAEKGLSIECIVDEGVPLVLLGDEGRLQQILTNLVGNAVKFTQQGGVRVEMRWQTGDHGAQELLCSVCDTGIGIPRERLDAIFDPFVQVDGSSTRRYSGTGLGLAICRRLVELMNGRLWVESTPGRGSTFRFTCVCATVPEVVRR